MSFFGGFPGFGGGGGYGGHSHPHEPEGPADTEGLYKILGIEKTATNAQIKKAFRKKAMSLHPDKGGDPEAFKECQKAYEILSDAEKRELYDQYGEKGVENGGPTGGGDLFDLFSGRGRGGGRGRKRKGQDVVFPLKVDLETLYNGGSKKLRLSRNVLCPTCNGAGGKDGKSPETCRGCRGQGVRVVVRQLGPGMIQQMQTQCPDCDGQGTTMREEDKCDDCHGKRVSKEKKLIEVFVPKGAENHHKIYFRGEADQAPDTEPGDVVVVIEQKEHPVFKRDGPNLILQKTISLVDALCGYEFSVQHLDGRWVKVATLPGQLVRPNDVLRVADQGMPYPRSPFQHGSIFVKFDIEFPEDGALNADKIKKLRKILPASLAPMDTVPADAHVDEHHLEEIDLQEEKRRRAEYRAANKEAYEDDEDDEEGGPSVGCRAQ